MSEQLSQKVTDYLQDYPEAVVDRDKAEVMAHASKYAELDVVDERNNALDAAANFGDETYDRPDGMSAERAIQEATSRAHAARTEANRLASKAAEVYDSVKNI